MVPSNEIISEFYGTEINRITDTNIHDILLYYGYYSLKKFVINFFIPKILIRFFSRKSRYLDVLGTIPNLLLMNDIHQ